MPILLCCEKKNNDSVVEHQIFASLLPEMVDAIYKDPEIYLNFQEALRREKIDSTQIDKAPSRADRRKKIVVAVSEILYPPDQNDIESLQLIIKSNNLKIQIPKSKIAHKLVFPVYNNKKYIFKYFSKSHEEESEVYTDGINDWRISVSFSRIQFDEKKDFGILTGTYDCRPQCGVGYVIIVRKTSNGWKVFKVFDTWVS
ncbi:hypothetical protein [Dyadobacter sp. CY356]|uniref:hypothetical protein n=1 Tax=Dyadobacter sp. CY356 TaxID=2906442 RepID=UPI001F2D4826|nr:hypothetical protein [Dyadobacter sp. CY356]